MPSGSIEIKPMTNLNSANSTNNANSQNNQNQRQQQNETTNYTVTGSNQQQ